MCFDMDINNNMSQDEIAVMKLNQLLLQMQTDFLSTNSLSAGVTCSEILLGNRNSGRNIPRSGTFPGKRTEMNKSTKEHRKISLPILRTQIKEEEVVDKLDGLLERLETIGEVNTSFSRTEQNDEPQYATVNKMKKTSGNRREYSKTDRTFEERGEYSKNGRTFEEHEYSKNDRTLEEICEPPYSTIDDIQLETAEVEDICEARMERARRYSTGSSSINDERYMLDDATRYIDNSWFPRHYSTGPKCLPTHSDYGYLRKFPSDGMLNDIHNLKEHSTLCRRLRTLEASVGITLKKQLHFFVKKRMKTMNVSGCVYCMYAFYEKHKKEAEEKAREIRKTIDEQELLQQTLSEQRKQSDADSLWLDSVKRYSWKDRLHESGSKSDSEQLGYDLAPPVIKKEPKLSPLRLRRKIPLWELLRKDPHIPFDQGASSTTTTTEDSTIVTATITTTIDDSTTSMTPTTTTTTDDLTNSSTTTTTTSEELTIAETTCSNIYTPLTVVTSLHENITSSNIESDKNDDSDLSSEENRRHSNDTIKSIESDIFRNSCSMSPQRSNGGKNSRNTRTSSVFSMLDDPDNVVYQHTTNVVKSVIELSTGVQHAQPEGFVDLVKVVGLNLRDLLAVVDDEIKGIPDTLHKDVEMAHRVLSSDMAELVAKMKIAEKYANTALDRQNRRNLLQAAHVLAIDAKHLYDTYLKSRDTPENSNPS